MRSTATSDTHFVTTTLILGAALMVGGCSPATGDGPDLPDCGTLSQVSEDTTLAAGTCHTVDGQALVTAALTIEEGVTIYFGSDASMSVRDSGSITALGTAAEPITFKGDTEVAGFWGGLAIHSDSPLNILEFVEFFHGGGTLYSSEADESPALLYIGWEASASVEDCLFAESFNLGMDVRFSATLLSFARNEFMDNEDAPIQLGADDLHSLDSASDYAGPATHENGELVIRVRNDDIGTDQTWPDVGLPYLFPDSTDIDVDADLVIAPGTTMIFGQDARMATSQYGSINAVGTSAAPITFTAEDLVPGAWRGLGIDSDSVLNILQFVEVSYAGRSRSLSYAGAEPANLIVGEAARATVEDSTLSDSLGWGIFFMGSATLTEARNTFTNNASGDVGTE